VVVVAVAALTTVEEQAALEVQAAVVRALHMEQPMVLLEV
jgi:hypothetical protein